MSITSKILFRNVVYLGSSTYLGALKISFKKRNLSEQKLLILQHLSMSRIQARQHYLKQAGQSILLHNLFFHLNFLSVLF